MNELNEGDVWENRGDSGRTLRIHTAPSSADPDSVKVVVLTATAGRPMPDTAYEMTDYWFNSDGSFSSVQSTRQPFQPLTFSLQELLAEWRPRR